MEYQWRLVTSRDSDVNMTSHHFATAGWENYLLYFFHPDRIESKGLKSSTLMEDFFSRRRWIAVAIHLTVRSGKSLGLVMFGVGTAIGMLAWQSFLSCAISKAFVLWSVLVSFFWNSFCRRRMRPLGSNGGNLFALSTWVLYWIGWCFLGLFQEHVCIHNIKSYIVIQVHIIYWHENK